MPAKSTSYRNDGRILDFHKFFGSDTEPEDGYVMDHGQTWGEFKAARMPRPVGHGSDRQKYPNSRTQMRRRSGRNSGWAAPKKPSA